MIFISAVKVNHRTYRDELVEQIKAVGQELIDRAEQMVGPDVDLISNFDILISFDQGTIPTLNFSTTVLSKKNHELILQKYNKKEK